MSSSLNVLILGHGEMGSAMEFLLAPHHRVRVWQRRGATPLPTAAADAAIVLFCVPTPPHAELAQALAPALAPTALCLTVAKGLDETGRTAVEALHATLGDRPYGVIYGPMIAEELRAGRPGFALLGLDHAQADVRAESLFQNTMLHIERATDIAGLSWCAVLKNVYALLFGAADELGLGDNMRGYLAVAAVAELGAICVKLGGHAASAATLAGLGDLITTATSRGSHHHALGQRIARGETAGLTGEGLHTLRVLAKGARLALQDYPLAALAARCALSGHDARTELDHYLEQHRAVAKT
ncbi:MAG: hypothetical protein JSW09_04290 [Pseudomonadota bacterium]|nr:MAG: hypothetical protein JSW09_04290 [Pseudomonadota bacterium]